MSDKIDVKACLKGTAYEQQSEFLAKHIERANINTVPLIDNLPALRLVKDPHALVAVILEKHQQLQKEQEVKETEKRAKKEAVNKESA